MFHVKLDHRRSTQVCVEAARDRRNHVADPSSTNQELLRGSRRQPRAPTFALGATLVWLSTGAASVHRLAVQAHGTRSRALARQTVDDASAALGPEATLERLIFEALCRCRRPGCITAATSPRWDRALRALRARLTARLRSATEASRSPTVKPALWLTDPARVGAIRFA